LSRDPITTVQTPVTAASRSLVIVADGLVKTMQLVDGVKRLTIGRADDVEVYIDEPSLSRRHAVLYLDNLAIEDFGSANGTFVRGRRLEPNVAETFALNEAIELGNVTIIVQQRSPTRPPRRLWGPDYFEARVDDECARGLRDPIHFGVVRVAARIDAIAVPEALGNLVRPGDVIGNLGMGEYAVLLLDTMPEQVEATAAQMLDAIKALGYAADVGIACYPRDGREAEQLIGAATPDDDDTSPSEEETEEVMAMPARVRSTRAPVVDPYTMQGLARLIERVAPRMISVLIVGETGSGKEVAAELIHRKSTRASQPFLKLNCAALSETLLESELFGHERGAFTGATQSKPGLLETADGGTVFLDEIGEMPLTMQAKLLRVLEERTLIRVGGTTTKKIDVRFIAATNRDLEAEVAGGRFREDLYYRLNGITLVVPPLRERVGEIAGLAKVLLEQIAERDGIDPPTVDPEALAALESYSWPGNVRELRNMLDRAALTAENGTIRIDDLPVTKMRTTMLGARNIPSTLQDLPTPRDLDVSEAVAPPSFVPRPLPDPRPRIQAALDQAGGNQTKAAQILGVSRKTLGNWLKRYNFPRPRADRS
jgi:transcriptional regulator with GAF, ATPase, and Fis domain